MINNSYDQIFISDLHLSTRACNHSDLRNFLANFYAPTMYLVGDCIDLWRLKTIESWPSAHTDILSDFIQLLQDGIDIKYIVGNHDEFLKNFVGTFSNISLMTKNIITIGDKRFLVTHGHQFDLAIRYFKWIGVWLTGVYDLFKDKGESSFSMSEYLKNRNDKVDKFEKLALEHVKEKGLDGIICGHTHKPNLFIKDDLIYANTGDFVTNSSFITQKDNILTLMAYQNNTVTEIKTIEL